MGTISAAVRPTVNGVRVLVDDVPAPLLYFSDNQLSFISPLSLASRQKVTVTVDRRGVRSSPITVAVAEAHPRIFTLDASGTGQAAAINENGSLNGRSVPAHRGSVLVFWVTGTGSLSPTPADAAIRRSGWRWIHHC